MRGGAFVCIFAKHILILLIVAFSILLLCSLSPGAEQKLFTRDIFSLRPVDYIFSRIARTMIFSFPAVIVSFIPAGGIYILMLRYERVRGLRTVRILFYGITTLPVFLLCYFSVILLNRFSPGFLPTEIWYFLAGILILGIGNNALGEFIRSLSTETERVLSERYITAAEARGVSLLKHSRRQILLVALDIGSSRLILTIGSGVIVVEHIFNIPGIGHLLLDAAKNNQRDVVLPVVIILAILVCLLRLSKDLAHLLIDRRGVYE